MQKKILIIAVFFGMLFSLQAQAPYQHSVGVSFGNMQAISYKTFLTDHFALQVDLGTKITTTAGCINWGKYIVYGPDYEVISKFNPINIWTLELNPNFLYEGHFVNGLYGMFGGGVSLGYNWYRGYGYDDNRIYYGDPSFMLYYNTPFGKFGTNVLLGLEYKFNAPVTLQLDVRPGYGLLFYESGGPLLHYADWSVNFGVRYTM